MSNYPDNIRQYDCDPRSPFHDSGQYQCCMCGGTYEGLEMRDNVCVYCLESEGAESGPMDGLGF